MILVIKRPEETSIERGIIQYDLNQAEPLYLMRPEAEKVSVGTHLPQLLVYMVLTYKDKVLTYSRKTGGEKRLHGLKSLGFGGHVDYADNSSTIQETLAKSAQRELKEELNMDIDLEVFLEALQGQVNLVVDNANDVGKVHLGVVMKIELPSTPKIKPEDEISLPSWKDVALLKVEKDQFEGWSQLVIEELL